MLFIQVDEIINNTISTLAFIIEQPDGWAIRPNVPSIRGGVRKTLDGALADVRRGTATQAREIDAT